MGHEVSELDVLGQWGCNPLDSLARSCFAGGMNSALLGLAATARRLGGWFGVLALVLPLAGATTNGPTPRHVLPRLRVAADHRTFETEQGQPFVPFGVNYFRPDTGWAPQLWKKFDPAATARDFARLRELGANCVRVFLSYGSFLNETNVLDPVGLAKFDQLLDLAEAAGLYVHPTGPDHWEGTPAWARGDRIADETNLAALENFWRLLAARYRDRHVLFAYDLRNEPEVAWDTPVLRRKWKGWLLSRHGTEEKAATFLGVKPAALQGEGAPPPEAKDALGDARLLAYQSFREDVADEWTRRQVAAIKASDPRALVTVGLIQWSVPSVLPAIKHYAAFRPQRQAPMLDFMEVHFYPLANGFYSYANAEEETRNLAYLESVVREVAACGKPVVVAEFGWYGGGKLTLDQGRHPPATDEQQARWCRRLVETTRGLATGWLNWGFFDHPEARDVTQLTGLLTHDGQPKAWAREFQTLARSWAGQAIPPVQLGSRPTLDWDHCLTSLAAAQQFRADYLRAFQAETNSTKSAWGQPQAETSNR